MLKSDVVDCGKCLMERLVVLSRVSFLENYCVMYEESRWSAGFST